MIKNKITLIVTFLVLSLGLAGCGFQPMHGTTASGELMKHQLSSVYVPLIGGREGQQVRNHLLFHLTGGDYPDSKKYVLNIAVKKSLKSVALARTGDAASKIFTLTADFTLSKADSTSQPIFKSRSTSNASYDTVYQQAISLDNGTTVKNSSTYSHIRARRNAADRAAKTIAYDIKTRIAAYLSANS